VRTEYPPVRRVVLEASDDDGLSSFMSWDGCTVTLRYLDDDAVLKVEVKSTRSVGEKPVA
jgi:hypothetical protein